MKASRGWTLSVAAGLVAVLALGACGDEATPAAATSIRDALGLDENAMQEREAKVQEEVRKCMEAEGFDYVPMDASRMNVRMVGPGMEDDAEFRRTKGYGITTTFGDRPEVAEEDRQAANDPNQAIREALSEEERKAYDKALFGRTASPDGDGGNFTVRVGSAGVVAGDEAGEGLDLSEAGCFGKAQEAVGGDQRIERVGPKLQELQERIESDPRVVKANADWAECMSEAGFDFESPEDIPEYLFGKMSDLQKELGGDGGPVGGDGGLRAINIEALADSPELAALQAEELALAKADDGCAESTGRKDIAKKVRAEAEKRFLEENPDLGQGN